jgi:hypothetical protein
VMVMANRDIHVFENDIADNATAAVMLVSYQNKFTDPTYNPLPRDIVVRANRYGKNGWDPQFLGGALIAKALGGTMPPVLWDGVTAAPGNKDPIRVRLMDGPVGNLQVPTPGALEKANPKLTPTYGDAVLPEPKPVVLPKRQAALAS